jgi:threonylcarbamoyladenosine tRNA methylthiotransferase MtaB
MARRTTQASFRDLAIKARECITDLNLSTDLIAGFPGETEADFAASLEFAAEMEFGRLHVFGYSKRPGTAAATMDGHVPESVKKERVQRLLALGNRLSVAFHARFEASTRDVLWETANSADDRGLKWIGYTDNYIRVTAAGDVDRFNQVTPTLLSEARPEGMTGIMLLEPESISAGLAVAVEGTLRPSSAN